MTRKIFFLISFLSSVTAFTQKLHLVSVGGTNNSEIGFVSGDKFNQATAKSLMDLDNKMIDIAQAINYEYKKTELTGDNFSKKKLKERVDALSVDSDDIVFLAVLAHGYNEKNLASEIIGGKRSEFPTTLLSYKKLSGERCDDVCWEENFLPFENFVNYLYKTKKPRLLISLVDACNDEIEVKTPDFRSEIYGVNKRLLEEDPEKYIINGISSAKSKDVLLGQTGMVLISSTKIGQKAKASPSSGFYYTSKFCQVVNDFFSNEQAVSFNNFISRLSTEVSEKGKFSIGMEDEPQNPKVFNLTKQSKPPANRRSQAINVDVSQNRAIHFLNRGRAEITKGRWEQARKIFMEGLKKYPTNEDLKMAVFIAEVNLEYDKFSTINFNRLNRVVEKNPKMFEGEGFAYLQYLIGMSYLKGNNGFKADVKKAAHWFIISFDNGNEKPSCRMLTRLGLKKCLNLL